MSDELFEIICKHKDTNPSNLNQVFESYGCNSLEAKVPVVDEKILDELQGASSKHQLYTTLSLKAESSKLALKGRPSRTRNKVLKVVQINGETIIATGRSRETTPVELDELDNDIEEYMRQGARLKANRTNTPVDEKKAIDVTKKLDNEPILTQEQMDLDLEAYMREGSRLREQKNRLESQTSATNAMSEMEDDINLDDCDVKFEF